MIAAVVGRTRDPRFLESLRRQADAIHRGSLEGLVDPMDREDADRRHRAVIEALDRTDKATPREPHSS